MVAAPNNAVGLCSVALVQLGCEPISSFDDGSTEAVVAQQVYPVTLDRVLSETRWSFARAHVRLPQLADVAADELAGFAGAYMPPSDLITVLSVGDGRRAYPYRLQGGRILCDLPGPILDYIRRPAETDFPPYFKSVLIAALAMDLCLPITENSQRMSIMADVYDRTLRQMKNRDSQQNPPNRIRARPFIDVR